MKTRIVRVGNSMGIRLPIPVLEQCRLRDVVELEIMGNAVIVRSAHVPRSGWAEAFAVMAERGDDSLPDTQSATE